MVAQASNGMTITRACIFIWILFVALYALLPMRAVAVPQCSTTTINGVPNEVCFEVPEGPTPTAPVFSNTVDANVMASCQNVNGALSTSVGVTAVSGGVFVPVNDAAVTLNTGILVYKECVLRKIVNAKRIDATAKLVKQTTQNFLKGRCVVDADGVETCGPYFPEVLSEDRLKLSDTVVARDVNGTLLDSVNPLFRDDVKRAIYRSYLQQTRNPGASLACSGTAASLARIQMGGYDGPQDLFTVADPNCNPLFNFFSAQALVMSDVAAEQEDMLTRLGWNRGVYDVTTTGADGVSRVVTPGFIIAGTMEQQLGSAFRQLENANDIGQMIDQMFAAIGNQIMTGTVGTAVGGLRGLLNVQFGQKSYLDQVVANTGTTLQNSTVSAAMQNLAAAVANESAYLAAKNATASVLTNAVTQLRTKEAQCWNQFVVPAVTTYALQNNIPRLKVATTTTASQAAIDKNIVPLAGSVSADIGPSNAMMTQINQIISGISGASPAEAYKQLDALVAGGKLHTSYDAQAAQKQTQDVQSALTAVVTDTITAWGDNQDPTIGWCNINNPAVVQMWANKWKQ